MDGDLMNSSKMNLSLFLGLRALADSAFPKYCRNCGRTFATAEQFIEETEQIRQETSGLKQSYDDDDITIVEVYRNCHCGSTLMDYFSNRRDLSEVGLNRRKKFGEMLDMIVAKGIERDVGRVELLKLLRGEHSEILVNLLNADEL